MTTANPFQSLTDAERTITGTLNLARQQLDTVGTDDLTNAVAKLQESARNAEYRLADAMATIASTVTGLAQSIQAMSAGLMTQILEGLPPMSNRQAAPVAEPAPVAPAMVEPEPVVVAVEPTPTVEEPGSTIDLASPLPEEPTAQVDDEPWELKTAWGADPDNRSQTSIVEQVTAAAANPPVPGEVSLPDVPAPTAAGKARSKSRRR